MSKKNELGPLGEMLSRLMAQAESVSGPTLAGATGPGGRIVGIEADVDAEVFKVVEFSQDSDERKMVAGPFNHPCVARLAASEYALKCAREALHRMEAVTEELRSHVAEKHPVDVADDDSAEVMRQARESRKRIQSMTTEVKSKLGLGQDSMQEPSDSMSTQSYDGSPMSMLAKMPKPKWEV